MASVESRDVIANAINNNVLKDEKLRAVMEQLYTTLDVLSHRAATFAALYSSSDIALEGRTISGARADPTLMASSPSKASIASRDTTTTSASVAPPTPQRIMPKLNFSVPKKKSVGSRDLGRSTSYGTWQTPSIMEKCGSFF